MELCEENGYRTSVQNLRLYSRWHDEWFDNDKMYYSVMDPAVQEMASIRFCIAMQRSALPRGV